MATGGETCYFCYILRCADGSFYTGWTTNPERRTRQHNHGTGARYTRAHSPVQLVYVEQVENRSCAMKHERAIKALPRAKKELLVRAQAATTPGEERDG